MLSLEVIIFGSVRFLSKKYNQTGFFQKNRKLKLVQTDQFWFGYFRTKTGFFNLARVFFFQVGFGLFGFRLIKLKSNRTG